MTEQRARWVSVMLCVWVKSDGEKKGSSESIKSDKIELTVNLYPSRIIVSIKEGKSFPF
jgi:hypothetical protein